MPIRAAPATVKRPLTPALPDDGVDEVVDAWGLDSEAYRDVSRLVVRPAALRSGGGRWGVFEKVRAASPDRAC